MGAPPSTERAMAPFWNTDPATEARIPLHQGSRVVVDTQRLWHVVVHNGAVPRYALITSFESGPVLDRWIDEANICDELVPLKAGGTLRMNRHMLDSGAGHLRLGLIEQGDGRGGEAQRAAQVLWPQAGAATAQTKLAV